MMEPEDMIVLVVVDDDESGKSLEKDNLVTNSCMEVENIIETAQKHGQFIDVKTEPEDYEEYDYLDSEFKPEIYFKQEPFDDDDDYIPDENAQSDETDTKDHHKRHRWSRRQSWQQRSFIAELRQKYEELRDDEELLVNTLEQIMRSVTPPELPQDYCNVINGIMYKCMQCGVVLETLPAAGRHYQEKHGQRYLVCYACGVDFRSTTNLYKHEKRCAAPDAHVVLKARAAFLGRKGRSRPYLTDNKFRNKRPEFPCQLCSAVFITRSNLESHENLHRGERPYRCHACPCAYTSYSALSRHAKKHTDIQFICDLCGRSFKIKAALASHMDTHKPIRKHGCDECNRRFAQKSALILHINRVHRNLPPPCACQICPKRYPRMSLLKEHMKSAHGMSIITRKMFFKSLPTMSELEVKQSKVVLKYDDDLLHFIPPIKPTPETVITEYTDDQNHLEKQDEVVQEMTVEEFMRYVKNDEDVGTNVVYIQNGEVVQMEEDAQGKLVLEVEAMFDAQVKVENESPDEDSGETLPVL
ncbi:zinc finger protein 260-like isoform X2 [Trichoplusia ni]|uniref:Zinc finger protein 260-like isoform X2 n=1 Tax=Trichoplusia ni TaxID=7111 RepID=A0A7E5W2H0_TRINI|nr:zinc finger protein 260-like isoform X2 [Trichoplusia ni]